MSRDKMKKKLQWASHFLKHPLLVQTYYISPNTLEKLCSQWEGSASTQSALMGGGLLFIFSLFPTCSLQVLNGFPSGSQYVP